MGAPPRVLITGAGGFVGANLVRRLAAAGHDVTAIARPEGTSWRLDDVGADVAVREVELADADAVDAAVRDSRPEWILHCAAHGAYSWESDFPRMVAANVLATDHLLRAAQAAGCAAFVHAGTSSEYGYQDHPAREDDPIQPNSRYAVTKAAATALCVHVASESGLRAVSLRIYSAYGPWEDPGRLVPALIVHGRRGELPPLVAPDTARDFVYVDDVADAFVCAARAGRPGGIYNVCSGRQTSLREIVDVARGVLAVAAEPQWGSSPARSWDTSIWVGDPALARRELGWEPTHALEAGLRSTAEWLERESAVHSRYGLAPR
jgi:nucleoside-diphosphate-sugar epimerase